MINADSSQHVTPLDGMDDLTQSNISISVENLTFRYPGIDGQPIPGVQPVLDGVSFNLTRGSRCLLVGPNGAGKTTVLHLLAGKHMIKDGSIDVLGRSPFHDTKLTSSGDLVYIGGNWERDISFAGYRIPLQGDFPASQMIKNVHGVDHARAEQLMKVMDVNPNWRMHLVSDGQRRRVQLCVGLSRPYKVLLLDEITVDLDVLGRANLMRFLEQESRERRVTIIYATHIFDGIEEWPTHVCFLAGGKLKEFDESSMFPEISQGRLLDLVVRWLREEKAVEKERQSKQDGQESIQEQPWNNGWVSGRLTSSLAGTPNTTMRM